MKDILIIEPFCGGSHGQLVQLLSSDEQIGLRCEKVCLPAKKWQWRARTSSLYLSQVIPYSEDFRVLFASSVLNLAELVALRQDLLKLRKILYFHENQLVYPVRKHQERDFQYGYNQILSSLVADVLIFNSIFNMESFLTSISSFLKLIPDHRPKNIAAQIRPKCQVLYFPIDMVFTQKSAKAKITKESKSNPNDTSFHDIKTEQDTWELNIVPETGAAAETYNISKDFDETDIKEALKISFNIDGKDSQQPDHSPSQKEASVDLNPTQHQNLQLLTSDHQLPCVILEAYSTCNDTYLKWDHINLSEGCLHIVWPHRWEHDKDPESFFAALSQLQEENYSFDVSVIGETFSTVPEVFNTARVKLGSRVKAWGFQSREDYFAILDSAHVVVSTALHEFFGVSMLEAVTRNCYPLCPNRLVYPEIYPKECLYSTQAQLVKRLRKFCQKPQNINTNLCDGLIETFSWDRLQEHYRKLLLAKK